MTRLSPEAAVTAPVPADPAPSGVLGRFRRAQGGVAAIEFALIAPVLLLMYVGGCELARAAMAQRRTSLLARTVADLTALGDTTSPMARATMNDILAASRLVYNPFDATQAVIRVAAIGIYMQGTTRTVRICSSDGSPRTARWPVGAGGDGLALAGRPDHRVGQGERARAGAGEGGVGGAEDRRVRHRDLGDDEVVLPAGVACPATSS